MARVVLSNPWVLVPVLIAGFVALTITAALAIRNPLLPASARDAIAQAAIVIRSLACELRTQRLQLAQLMTAIQVVQ